MRDAVTQWLKNKFAHVPDVKYATTEPDPTLIYQVHAADIVLQTWMGARVYVYIIDKEPKLRELRNLLRENTRNSIGTLFVVDGNLLPEDEAYIKQTEDWQHTLFTLNGGWIYGYYRHEETDGYTATLAQVHFNNTPIQGHFTIWHLTDFKIENVAVRRRDVQEGIRGTWSIADIASPSYKRRVSHERVNHRFHYKTKQTHEVRQPPASDHLAVHYGVLQVASNASEKDVKAAYRRMAMMLHPDVSALPKSESERRFKQLNESYEAIKQYHGWG